MQTHITFKICPVDRIMGAFSVFLDLLMMSQGQWIEHKSPALPRISGCSAIAHYNHSIWILYVLYVSILGKLHVVFR